MKKFVLIYNPVSGKAAFKSRLDNILEAFQQRDCMLIIYRTKKDNSGLGDFIREADPDGLLAAGGDGTLHEVVNLLMREHIELPVAILPSGTSNDFATYLGVDADQEAYFDHIAAGRTRKVDLGLVGSEYFVNVASAGMVTSIAHEVDVRLKNVMGKMAYYLRGLSTLPQFHPLELSIQADGEQVFDGRAFLFVIVNSGVVGSFKNAAVAAKVDDGKLDMLIVKYCSMPEIMALTAEILAGRDISRQKNVVYIQASSFAVSAAEDIESDLDGELGPKLPLTVETVYKAIDMYY
jgi:YegS/Rv2252/BmrU family lipid kinase